MPDPEPWHLLDSNILLRLGIQRHPDFRQVRAALDQLESRHTPLAYTLQNMAEFWNVATRPVDRNGFGLAIEQADLIAREFEAAFNFLPDTGEVYRRWRMPVKAHGVRGLTMRVW